MSSRTLAKVCWRSGMVRIVSEGAALSQRNGARLRLVYGFERIP